MTDRQAWALTAAAALLWVGAASSRVLGVGGRPADPSTALPLRLSQTGLYADAAALAVDPRNRPFAPQYPLWSDGAAKRRWIGLPDGGTIDTSDVDRWDFPVGTRLWKEFTFAGRRVETRYFVKTAADRWAFGSYVWTEDQRDARLAPDEGVANAAEIAPGKWHHVPSREECRACHESGRIEVLGFGALQLSDDRDPLAPHAEPLAGGMITLATLVREGRLRPARPELATTPPRVAAGDARERAVLGYLSSNCGSCHNRHSTIASLGLLLRYETAPAAGQCAADALATTVDQPGHWVVPAAPDGASRLVRPGRPDLSALLHRVKSRRPSSQMPPIGTAIADREAAALLSAWIEHGGGAAATSGCAPRTSH